MLSFFHNYFILMSFTLFVSRAQERLLLLLLYFLHQAETFSILNSRTSVGITEIEGSDWANSVLCTGKLNDRGTQRQFSGKYLFGRRFEI